MTHVSMTVHEALAEIKMLDKRLEKTIDTTHFATENKHNNAKIAGQPIAEFVENAERAYQSITDMLARRKALRNAVAVSNAATKVTVAGEEYTMSELIEMRTHGMEYYNSLLQTMTRQMNYAKQACNRVNANLDAAADTFVANMMGSKEKVASGEGMTMRQAYVDANTMEIVSVPAIEQRMLALSESIDAFNTEVDSKISISNALTVIECDY